jgi:hypothetical protein
MKELIDERFSGQCCTIDTIAEYLAQTRDVSRKTIVWTVDSLVKNGVAARIGRGVYDFAPKPLFSPLVSEIMSKISGVLSEKLKYLEVTITDTEVLSRFMELQPFSTVVSIEVKKAALDAVVAVLRRKGLAAYAKKDYPQISRYIDSSQLILVRQELTVNPTLPQVGNVRIANLEKMLVDLVCDEDIYGQYQGEELDNIYQNITMEYSVNYSQILRYAAARKKKQDVLFYLERTSDFMKVRDLL